MSELAGWVHFPGVQQVVQASYTLRHGITPSLARLIIAPQPGFSGAGGPLSFHFGKQVLAFQGCKLEHHRLVATRGGHLWELVLVDRRWAWRYGSISGLYNDRDCNGRLKVGHRGSAEGVFLNTERTPRQLARLCLLAMGESQFDLNDLPNEARPRVDWQQANPAAALARLVEPLGCRVVLQTDGSVAIRKVGQGQPLPPGPVMEDSLTIDPPERPDVLELVCGPTRYQVDLELEAVGLDMDDLIKPLDALTYKPASGWSTIDLPHFHGLSRTDARERAFQTVFRWYRIKPPAEIPGFGPIRGRASLLPLDTSQVAMLLQDGIPQCRTPQLWGEWFPGKDASLANTARLEHDPQKGPYALPYTIDRQAGIVRFAQPVVRNADTEEVPARLVPAAAKLLLRTAVQIREPERVPDRFVCRRNLYPAFGTPARVLRREETHLTVEALYDAQGRVTGTRTNLAELEMQCRRELDLLEAEYATRLPQVRRYAGLLPIGPDGAIQQVHWEVGPRGATTTVCRNQESPRLGMLHAERRAWEQMAE